MVVFENNKKKNYVKEKEILVFFIEIIYFVSFIYSFRSFMDFNLAKYHQSSVFLI